LLLLQRLY